MKKSFLQILFIAGMLMFVFNACVKKKDYPKIPSIEYKDFIPYTDESGDLQIKFSDGNGDIGVNEGDSTKTFFVTYYYQDTVSKKFVGYYSTAINDTLRTGYIINTPSDAYLNKPISGEISVRLQQFRHSRKIKHIKYVMYLMDKEGNKSNVVTSPDITVP